MSRHLTCLVLALLLALECGVERLICVGALELVEAPNYLFLVLPLLHPCMVQVLLEISQSNLESHYHVTFAVAPKS